MYCNRCGAKIYSGQTFCSTCGHPLTAAAPVSSANSASPPASMEARGAGTGTAVARSSCVAPHLRVLGILWIIYSSLRLVPGVAMMVFGHMHFPFLLMPVPARIVEFLGPFVFGLGAAISVMALAGVMAGVGLLTYSPWARILAIVLACINVIHIPFGTALGIYTLWVLFSPGAEREYARLGTCR